MKPSASLIGMAEGRLEALVERAVASGRIPSAIGMLATDGEDSWIRTWGDMGPAAPMRPDSILPLASAGKIFTATAVMLLVEQGTIAVDQPVSHQIPEFADVMVQDGAALVPPDRPVTIHHLLTHTAGLQVDGEEFWKAWNTHSDRTTTGDLARALARLPLMSHPGSAFAYGVTGASYEVLGAVVEATTGLTLEAFMSERIFEPLGLEDSHFFLPPEKRFRLPAFYERVDGELVMRRALGEDYPRSTFFHGGGGVQAPPADILRFGRMLLQGGTLDGVRLLDPGTVEQMMTDHVGDLLPMPGVGWGYGAAIRTPSGRFGWIGGGYAKVWIDPENGLVAYFAFPLTPPGDAALLDEIESLVYSA